MGVVPTVLIGCGAVTVLFLIVWAAVYTRRLTAELQAIKADPLEIERKQLERGAELAHLRAESEVPTPAITDEDTIRALSNRLASLEGTLPNLRSAIESYDSLTRRVSALETEIPGLADAWERFSDSMDRKDKRDGERDRRGRKKETQLAGDAAQEFLGPLGSGTGVPGVTPPGAPPITNGGSRAIVGKGRNRGPK